MKNSKLATLSRSITISECLYVLTEFSNQFFLDNAGISKRYFVTLVYKSQNSLQLQ